MIPPGGTVTFLFTDIEGSTQLWEHHAEAMRSALALHDLIMRKAIQDNAGYVFKTGGDAFFAAFATAPEALLAAVKAQLGLRTQNWGELGPLRVRIAIHTGDAEQRDGDYFGPSLNRVARLQAITYGEQILLSQASYELVRDRLPENVSLRPLGLHRLKDLNRPEHVYQVAHPDLRAEFPPLKSLDSLPNNLPIQLSSFIGREAEMEKLGSLIVSHRLVTLLGPGGTGKTRLSLQFGADSLDRFADGIWFVELAPISDPALAAQAVAAALGIREASGMPLVQTLVGNLRDRTLLLIFDNCEHLLDACARLAETLLQACPGITILTSSREALKIPGEATLRVPPLNLPDPNAPVTLETISEFEAVRLFIDRAASIVSTFVVTSENAPALAQLCARLDGIPLAIELAAAQIRFLSVEEINARLDNRFQLLTGGSRSALPRQQTLRALIDWSYDMLTDPEQALLRRLSVFSGGWTLEAAAEICSNWPVKAAQMFDLIASLTDKSLVTAEPTEDGTRCRLLETIRQYAGDRLKENGEAVKLRERHRSYFLQFVEDLERQLSGPTQQECLALFEREQDNLRAALEGALSEEPSIAAPLAAAMGEFWYLGGYLREGSDCLEQVLAQKSSDPTVPGQAEALFQAGRIASETGDYELAKSYLNEALEVFRICGETRAAARALNSLGTVLCQQDLYDEALAYLNQSLALHKKINNTAGIAVTLINLGVVARCQGDLAASRAYNEETLELNRKLGDKRAVASALINLGNVWNDLGDLNRARAVVEESLEIGRELGDDWYTSYSLSSLAVIAVEQNEIAAAKSMAEEALGLVRNIGDRVITATLQGTLAEISRREGDFEKAQALLRDSLSIRYQLGQFAFCAYLLERFAEIALAGTENDPPEILRPKALRAAALLGAAERLRESVGVPLPPDEREAINTVILLARPAAGEPAFEAAWSEGRAMSSERAVAYALQTNPRE